MSATSGALTCVLIFPKASAASSVGTDTRTMSTPAASSARICATVAATSVVSVLVMLWTLIGASPPTATPPTMMRRHARRFMGFARVTSATGGPEREPRHLPVLVLKDVVFTAVELEPHPVGAAKEHAERRPGLDRDDLPRRQRLVEQLVAVGVAYVNPGFPRRREHQARAGRGRAGGGRGPPPPPPPPPAP